MNEIKRSLIEIAGDMSESIDRVRIKLKDRHEKDRDYKKNFVSAVGVVALIFVLFLTTNLLMKEQLGDSSTSNDTMIGMFDDKVFETSLKLRRGWEDFAGEEYQKEMAFEEYEKKLAIYTYAISLGYEIKEEEVEKFYNTSMKSMTLTNEIKSSYDEIFSKVDLTWEEFESYILEIAPYEIALEKLKQHYIDIYPKIEWNIAASLAEKHAVPYFREHYTNDIIGFKNKHSLPLHDGQISSGQKSVGRVVAFEDNMFLVSTKATIEDIETLSKKQLVLRYSTEGTWYPLDDSPEISEGDLVETYYKMQTSTSSTTNVSDLWDVNILDNYNPESINKNTVALTVNKDNISKVKSFVTMLEWEMANFKFSSSPDYELVVNDIVYQIWSHTDGFVLYSSKNVYRKLNEDFTEELAGYLGIDSGVN